MFGSFMWGTTMWGSAGITTFAMAAACRREDVEAENRFFVVPFENRFYDVPAENRFPKPKCNTIDES